MRQRIGRLCFGFVEYCGGAIKVSAEMRCECQGGREGGRRTAQCGCGSEGTLWEWTGAGVSCPIGAVGTLGKAVEMDGKASSTLIFRGFWQTQRKRMNSGERAKGRKEERLCKGRRQASGGGQGALGRGRGPGGARGRRLGCDLQEARAEGTGASGARVGSMRAGMGREGTSGRCCAHRAGKTQNGVLCACRQFEEEVQCATLRAAQRLCACADGWVGGWVGGQQFARGNDISADEGSTWAETTHRRWGRVHRHSTQKEWHCWDGTGRKVGSDERGVGLFKEAAGKGMVEKEERKLGAAGCAFHAACNPACQARKRGDTAGGSRDEGAQRGRGGSATQGRRGWAAVRRPLQAAGRMLSVRQQCACVVRLNQPCHAALP